MAGATYLHMKKNPTNHHQGRLYRCACCLKTATATGMVWVDNGTENVLVIRSHKDAYLDQIRRKDELREFLHNHGRRNWLHRLWWARSMYRLSLYAHGDPKGARWAALMFASPRRIANFIASKI